MTSLDPFIASPSDRDQVLYTQLPNQDLQLCTGASHIGNRPFVANLSCTVKFHAEPGVTCLGKNNGAFPWAATAPRVLILSFPSFSKGNSTD